VDEERKHRKEHLSGEGDIVQDPSVDQFLTRLSYDVRRPKPGEEAVAAAFQAVQRLAFEADAEAAAESVETHAEHSGSRLCQACGSQNREGNKFCSTCGVRLAGARAEAPHASHKAVHASPENAPGEHHYHHHYHHHYFSSTEGVAAPPAAEIRTTAPREASRARTPSSGQSLSRAEAAIRQVSKDWIQACNTKQLDDLVDLYAADALVMRPNVPAVRGTAAIREYFFSVLDSGFGEVEFETTRVETFGEVAYEAGRCKMLVPTLSGKRREERGKYLMVLARQNGGDWKILSDCWLTDLSLVGGAESEGAKTASHGAGVSIRAPRKGP